MPSQNVVPRSQKSFRKRIRHPPCILDLLHHGVPSDIECDTAHLLLVRYVVTKGLSDVQGRKMAQTMIRNSVFFGGSREVHDPRSLWNAFHRLERIPGGTAGTARISGRARGSESARRARDGTASTIKPSQSKNRTTNEVRTTLRWKKRSSRICLTIRTVSPKH